MPISVGETARSMMRKEKRERGTLARKPDEEGNLLQQKKKIKLQEKSLWDREGQRKGRKKKLRGVKGVGITQLID